MYIQTQKIYPDLQSLHDEAGLLYPNQQDLDNKD
jgi:hypothetical protein